MHMIKDFRDQLDKKMNTCTEFFQSTFCLRYTNNNCEKRRRQSENAKEFIWWGLETIRKMAFW